MQAGLRWSQGTALPANTTMPGWKRAGSSRVEAKGVMSPCMPELVLYTPVPQVGQKWRVTVLPLSAR